MKQSSIELIEKEIDFKMKCAQMDYNNHVDWSMSVVIGAFRKLLTEVEQAKQMHKQEIIEAYEEGQNTPYEYSEDNDVNYYDGRNYYKNTYEKE